MSLRFTLGRTFLGLLLILQGILLLQGNFKDQLQQMKDLRSFLLKEENKGILSSILWTFVHFSDDSLTYLVYTQSVLLVIAGSLVIANIRFGGLLMTVATITFILTRDNPLLGSTEESRKQNFQNMLKDLAVAGMGILLLMRKQIVKHRKPDQHQRYERIERRL